MDSLGNVCRRSPGYVDSKWSVYERFPGYVDYLGYVNCRSSGYVDTNIWSRFGLFSLMLKGMLYRSFLRSDNIYAIDILPSD